MGSNLGYIVFFRINGVILYVKVQNKRDIKYEHKISFETIDMLSKGITQYAFRSGPVEEMHARGKLTQKDMKTLNKYMVNRTAGLLTIISNGDISKALKVLSFYASLSSDWDTIKADIEEFHL